MKKITLFISALALVSSIVNAQSNLTTQAGITFQIPATRTCATMEANSPEAIANFEEQIAPQVAAYLQNVSGNNSPEAVYNIPTIVHIIHNSSESVGSGRNIPNARVLEQIQILNDDFRRTNADKINTPSGFVGVAADCQINFCLITKYPSGHPSAGQTLPERGVDRVSTSAISGISNTTSGYSMSTIDNTIKPATSWNPNEVMNIWVCQLQSGLLGYATFPNSGSANKDGTVMGYQFFGKTSSSPYHLGRTTTHEVGHWLGCYHIWGDDNGACSGSDQVSDTPNQANSTGGCPSGTRTDGCTGSSPGIMYQNYMDYSNDACMNVFTAGQKARMQSVMASQPRRSTLNGFSATLCAATGIDDLENVDGISIYPNPTKNIINISSAVIKNSEVAIYNMLGEMIYQNNSTTKNTITVDMTNQPNGVYFVKVKSDNKVITSKVLLTK